MLQMAKTSFAAGHVVTVRKFPGSWFGPGGGPEYSTWPVLSSGVPVGGGRMPGPARGTATSAIWKAIQRPWLTTLAPILINFSLKLVGD
jgi:hypothetical protein